MAKRTSKKSILESVNGGGSIGPTGNQSMSVVAAASQDRALSPKQCYELNSTFRRAVNVVAENEAKAQLRLFSRKSGEEIESGPLFNLLRRPNRYATTGRFISEMATWFKISGEIAIIPIMDGTNQPIALKLLDPSRMIAMPAQVRSLEFVDYWIYNDGWQVDGKSAVMQIPSTLLMFAKCFNPYSQVRGLSPAITLVNEVSTNYYVQRYNISRFKNGVKGDLVFAWPKGTKPAVMEDFTERWQQQHAVGNDNGFRIGNIAGDVTLTELGAVAKDGEYLELSNWNEERIGSLLGVPASVMGWYSKTRFDTIEAELQAFAENTLLPDLHFYSEFFQHQIVDRYFPSAVGTQKTKKSLSSAMRKELERTFAESNGESDVVVILDPDTLPIMGQINNLKVKQVKDLRENLMMSANEAATHLGIDLEPNPLRDDIYVPSGMVNVSLAAQNTQTQAEIKAIRDEMSAMRKEIEAPKSLSIDGKAQLETLKGFYRELRAEVLASFANNEWINKAPIIAKAQLIGNKLVQKLHRDIIELHSLYKAKDTAGVKAFFNTASKPSALKSLIEETHD